MSLEEYGWGKLVFPLLVVSAVIRLRVHCLHVVVGMHLHTFASDLDGYMYTYITRAIITIGYFYDFPAADLLMTWAEPSQKVLCEGGDGCPHYSIVPALDGTTTMRILGSELRPTSVPETSLT